MQGVHNNENFLDYSKKENERNLFIIILKCFETNINLEHKTFPKQAGLIKKYMKSLPKTKRNK